ncbi:MAG: DciA family protein [Nocardioides sp.]|nr:DciA family protein [Nocardioides sp.]
MSDEDPTPPEPAPDAPRAEGLDLARSIARSLAGNTRARRGPRPGSRRQRTVPSASGAHPDDRDPQSVEGTIGRLIAEQGWGTDIRVHGVFTRWDAIVGREVAQHCTPESFHPGDPTAADPRGRVGRLVVRTDSTAWATQVRMLAPTVVRRLNEELGEGTIGVIDVQGPRGPTWRKGPRSVRDGRGPRDTYG